MKIIQKIEPTKPKINKENVRQPTLGSPLIRGEPCIHSRLKSVTIQT